MKSGKDSSQALGRARTQRSLAVQLAVFYGSTAFLLVAVATGFTYWALHDHLETEANTDLTFKMDIVRNIIIKSPTGAAELRHEIEVDSSVGDHESVDIRLLGPDGSVFIESDRMPQQFVTIPVLPLDGASGSVRSFDFELPSNRPYRVLVQNVDVPTSGATARYQVQVGLDRTSEVKLLAAYRHWVGIILFTSLIVAAASGYLIARRGLRPIAVMAAAMRELRSSNLDRRMPYAGLPTEVVTLAESFNDLLDRLQDSFARLNQFSADIAHELRNPINTLRGEAEVAISRTRTADEYKQVIMSSLEECDRLSKLIQSLLFLARADRPDKLLQRQELDLAQELTHLVEYYEASASEAGIDLHLDVSPGVTLLADKGLLQRAVANLIENAITYTPQSGSIHIEAITLGQLIQIAVSDTGPGISAQDLPHVFDRLYRADGARASADIHGAGLGLTIVRQIARLHGGDASVDENYANGTRVVILMQQETTATEVS